MFRDSESPSPLLVHCSAGVGRTGKFSAILRVISRPCLALYSGLGWTGKFSAILGASFCNILYYLQAWVEQVNSPPFWEPSLGQIWRFIFRRGRTGKFSAIFETHLSAIFALSSLTWVEQVNSLPCWEPSLGHVWHYLQAWVEQENSPPFLRATSRPHLAFHKCSWL